MASATSSFSPAPHQLQRCDDEISANYQFNEVPLKNEQHFATNFHSFSSSHGKQTSKRHKVLTKEGCLASYGIIHRALFAAFHALQVHKSGF
jgi:hypothetical protein